MNNVSRAKRVTKLTFVLGAFALLSYCINVQANPHEARTKLEGIAATMIETLQDPAVRQDRRRLEQLVVDVLVPHIDFRASSYLVLGPHWQEASAPQRDAFINEFSSFLVRFYTGALASYVDSADIPADIISFREEPVQKGERELRVVSQVRQAGGDSVPVEYRMFRHEQWKVVDVSVAGISMVNSYRGSFSSTVKRDGLDVLIAQLAERNQTFLAN